MPELVTFIGMLMANILYGLPSAWGWMKILEITFSQTIALLCAYLIRKRWGRNHG